MFLTGADGYMPREAGESCFPSKPSAFLASRRALSLGESSTYPLPRKVRDYTESKKTAEPELGPTFNLLPISVG